MRIAALPTLLLSASLLVGGMSRANAAPLVPQDFAYGLPIVTTGDATAYSVVVPLEVYQASVSPALGDLRVFNADGEEVPYSLKRRGAEAQEQGPARPLPLFPLRSGSRVVIDGVRVTIDSPDSSVKLQTQKGSAGEAPWQYVIDARSLTLPVAALQLNWPETSTAFSGRVRIDASDDLDAWRTIIAAAPIANLQANGQQLIERRVELPPTRAKYWRLSWVGAEPPFELSEVLAETAERPAEVARVELLVGGSANTAHPGEYLFDLGAHLPVERVNLVLPEPNTVVAVDLESRARKEDPWRSIVHAGFYRLKVTDGEQSNAPIAIGTNRDRYWRASVASNATIHGSPQLKVLWAPNEVVFLARGKGPFLMAYGDATAQGAEVDLAAVPTNIPIVHAWFGPLTVLGGPSRLTAPAATRPSKGKVLWLVLVAGVCLLAWMAYRLVQEQGADAESPP